MAESKQNKIIAGIAAVASVGAGLFWWLNRLQRKRTPVIAENAPAAIGPYSHAVKANGFVFVSGQIGVDPKSGEFVGSDVESQTQQVLRNMSAILQAAGSDASKVVKTTILLADMADFSAVNKVYGAHFACCKDGFPARATFAVKGLPKNALVEIEAVATL